jgi:Leucine-rich repeat (LRR) protein
MNNTAVKTIKNWPEFIETIASTSTLTKLELIDVRLEENIEKWLDVIKSNTLEYLKIAGCYLTEYSADRIFEAIIQSESIASLSFRNDTIVAKKLNQLAEIILSKPQITELDLFYADFQNIKQVEALGKIVKANQLTRLGITGCFYLDPDQSFAETFCRYLQYDNTLEYLDINCTAHRDSGATLLATWLEKSTAIKTLCINNNSITEAGYSAIMKALSKNKSLQVLGISHNQLTDRTMQLFSEVLAINETLQELHMDIKNIEHMKLLCEAMKSNVSITESMLNLWSRGANSVKLSLYDKAADYILDMLEVNETLTTLNATSLTKKKEREINELFERNKAFREGRVELLVVIHNIARSRESYELFPVEIWLSIFEHLKIRNWGIPRMSKEIFKLHNEQE